MDLRETCIFQSTRFGMFIFSSSLWIRRLLSDDTATHDAVSLQRHPKQGSRSEVCRSQPFDRHGCVFRAPKMLFVLFPLENQPKGSSPKSNTPEPEQSSGKRGAFALHVE